MSITGHQVSLFTFIYDFFLNLFVFLLSVESYCAMKKKSAALKVIDRIINNKCSCGLYFSEFGLVLLMYIKSEHVHLFRIVRL